MTEQLNKTDARQGVTGHKVRYVLGASMALAVAAVVVIYFSYYLG